MGLGGCLHVCVPRGRAHRAGPQVPTQGKERQRQARKEWNICWPRGKCTGTEGSEIPFYSPYMILPMACQLVGRPSSPTVLSSGISRPPWPGVHGPHCFRHSSAAGEARLKGVVMAFCLPRGPFPGSGRPRLPHHHPILALRSNLILCRENHFSQVTTPGSNFRVPGII